MVLLLGFSTKIIIQCMYTTITSIFKIFYENFKISHSGGKADDINWGEGGIFHNNK